MDGDYNLNEPKCELKTKNGKRGKTSPMMFCHYTDFRMSLEVLSKVPATLSE